MIEKTKPQAVIIEGIKMYNKKKILDQIHFSSRDYKLR